MKNVIITGTSRGIGFKLAQIFADHQYNVLALSRNPSTLKKIAHPNITILSVDLCKGTDVQKVQDFVQNQWEKVDILINNAGTLINKAFSKTSTEDFITIYKTNVFAVAELTRLLLPFLQKGSHVVNISSMGGIQGSMKFAGLAAYSSSKGALITLTELLAEEHKDQGIAFNVLAIGAVQTEMLTKAFPDYKAPLTALEMANYIFDFSTTGNKYYNGKILQVSSSTP